MQLSKLIECYILALEGVRSQSTVAWSRSILRRLLAHCGDVDVAALGIDDLRAWRATLAGLSSWYKNAGPRVAKQLFKFAEAEGHCANIAARLEGHKPVIHPRPGIALDDARRMLLAARSSPRDFALLCFFAETGARLGGVTGLQVEDVDWQKQVAFVTEKGNKRRFVFFSRMTAEALRAYIGPRTSGPVWLSERGSKPMLPHGIADVFVRLAKKAGVKKNYSPHQWRHMAARQWLTRGASLAHVSQLLGHSDSRVTIEFYLQFGQSELQSAHTRASYLDKALLEPDRC